MHTAHLTYLAITQSDAEPMQETRDMVSKPRGWDYGYGIPGLPDGPNLTLYHCLAVLGTGAWDPPQYRNIAILDLYKLPHEHMQHTNICNKLTTTDYYHNTTHNKGKLTHANQQKQTVSSKCVSTEMQKAFSHRR